MTTTKHASDLRVDDTLLRGSDGSWQWQQIVGLRRIDDDFELDVYTDKDPNPVTIPATIHDDFTVLDEREDVCPTHGVVTITESGSSPGFCAGSVYWTALSCGCQIVDDQSYLES